jgi:hypothetical protein
MLSGGSNIPHLKKQQTSKNRYALIKVIHYSCPDVWGKRAGCSSVRFLGMIFSGFWFPRRLRLVAHSLAASRAGLF